MAHAGHPRFLPRALASLAAQTLPTFELLLIDDASGADLRALGATFPTLRLQLLQNESRIGLAASLNRGLRACRTPFVARMDSDDISLPTRLERQLEWLVQKPQVVLLGTAVRYIDELGCCVSRTFPLTEHEDLRLGLLAYNQFAHGSIMAHTEALLGVGGYDESLEVSQDYDLWLRLLRAGKRLANLPEPLYEQRLHDSSASVLRREQQILGAKRARDVSASLLASSTLAEFFARGRHRPAGRAHERQQLGKLALFSAALAGGPGVPLGLRARAVGFACRHAADAFSAVRQEGAWRREWSRWLRLVVRA